MKDPATWNAPADVIRCRFGAKPCETASSPLVGHFPQAPDFSRTTLTAALPLAPSRVSGVRISLLPEGRRSRPSSKACRTSRASPRGESNSMAKSTTRRRRPRWRSAKWNRGTGGSTGSTTARRCQISGGGCRRVQERRDRRPDRPQRSRCGGVIGRYAHAAFCRDRAPEE